MIFRGRSATNIMLDCQNELLNICNFTSYSDTLVNVIKLSNLIGELIGGPALGITLTFFFMFISYKLLGLIFNKLFNRK
jgi:hypothetical protein